MGFYSLLLLCGGNCVNLQLTHDTVYITFSHGMHAVPSLHLHETFSFNF